MKLKIEEVTGNSCPPCSYEVVIGTTSYDGETHTNLTFGPFLQGKDEDALESLMETVLYLKHANAKEDIRDLSVIRNGILWLTNNAVMTEDEYEEWINQRGESVGDLTYSEYEKTAAFARGFGVHNWPSPYDDLNEYYKHHVYYYDENREQHAVTVENVKLYEV
jgi:hypothetical protein